MSLVALISVVGLAWIALHALARYLNRPTNSQDPFHAFPARRLGPFRTTWFLGLSSSNTDVTLKHVTLRVSTTAWNEPHDKLAALFLRRSNRRMVGAVKRFYDVGTAVGVLGMGVGLLGLVWITGASYWREFTGYSVSDEQVGPFQRRDLDGLDVRQEGTRRLGEPTLTPIIPGVTVPLSDLPIIIVSVFLSQAMHEFGHAVAAALEAIPMMSSGATLMLVIPAAFVALSTASMSSLEKQGQARIIAAGPFHNIVFWVVLVVSRLSGLDDLMTSVWYKDISAVGRSVMSVEAESPLYEHLIPGTTLVAKLDDTSLNTSADLWSKFLHSKPSRISKGWCLNPETIGNEDLCCPVHVESTQSCILSAGDESRLGCVDPIPLLTRLPPMRCESVADCPDGDVCGNLINKRELLRITVRDGNQGSDKVLLWSGPRIEVWEQIQISKWLPRWPFISLNFLNAIQIFRSYMEMTALSLFFFNLLPIWHLDGTQLLKCLLHRRQALQTSTLDPETLREQHGTSWRGQIPIAFSTFIAVIAVAYLALQIYRLI
ncbi:hypothetical protein FA15DRAFT_704849 [Coprinopsis marcescibilis]|uniref:Endopeptidase S2P n=1 Tax=Coprinopsis marcescibilis TaxID=230819 RepID=A0A5C3KUU3_COPMA|nr:hypothetical protein FA15DRAFT_704849 [Coprinopsis marcescibilis]